jgi:hypothetical protein
MRDFFNRLDVWAVVVAVLATVIATAIEPVILRVARGLLFFLPHYLGASFKSLFRYAKELVKAEANPLGATVYVAHQLSLLILNVALGLPSLFLFYILATSQDDFVTVYRVLLLLLTGFAVLLFAWRGWMRLVAIRLIYEAVLDQKETAATVTSQTLPTEASATRMSQAKSEETH